MNSQSAISDPARLEALRHTNLLDSLEEEGFDQLARMAARLLEAPIGLVSLVDVERQFFKSCIGEFPEPFRSKRQTPLSHSFCRHVVESSEPLLIENAVADPLVCDNPLVIEYGVRAYAGFPLITHDGHVIGTLCVVDSRPRQWQPEQVETLRSLALVAMTAVAYRSAALAKAPEARVDQSETVLESADGLADEVTTYLGLLDEYDSCLRLGDPAQQLRAEAELREALGRANASLRHSAAAFRALADRAETEPDGRTQLAEDLFLSLQRLFAAQDSRTEASARFQRLEVPLEIVEQQVRAVATAEQSARSAHRIFCLSRD